MVTHAHPATEGTTLTRADVFPHGEAAGIGDLHLDGTYDEFLLSVATFDEDHFTLIRLAPDYFRLVEHERVPAVKKLLRAWLNPALDGRTKYSIQQRLKAHRIDAGRVKGMVTVKPLAS